MKPGKSPFDLFSYGPVPLLSRVGKLMGKLVHARLERFCGTKAIASYIMFGFRHGGGDIENVIDLVISIQ